MQLIIEAVEIHTVSKNGMNYRLKNKISTPEHWKNKHTQKC